MKEILQDGDMLKMELESGGNIMFHTCLLSDMKAAAGLLVFLDDAATTLQAAKSVAYDMRGRESRLIRRVTTKKLLDFLSKNVCDDCRLEDLTGAEIAIVLLAMMGIPSDSYKIKEAE